MKNSITGIFLSFACLMLISGCSSLNETLWQSLKARDASMHPSLDQPRPMENSTSYEQYTAERKKALEKPQ